MVLNDLITQEGWRSPIGWVFFLACLTAFVLSVVEFISMVTTSVVRPSLAAWLRKPRAYGWKEAIALSASLLVTILLVIFHDQFGAFEEWGYTGAFLAMLVSSATLVLPSGGLVIVFLLGSALPNPWLLGVAAGLGSAIGEFTGYMAGYSSRNVVTRTKAYHKIKGRVERNATWTILALAAIPNPLFDIAGVAAGALKLPWWKFFFPALVGKIAKTLAIALAGYYSVGWIERLIR